MSLWAQLDNDNKVLQVIVGEDDLEDAYEWIVANLGGRWVLTTNAGIGWTYLEDVGFHSPQPFPSWTLNGLTWQAPKEKPEGDNYWNEEEQEWIDVELS
jgi:hypothetical protein